RADDAELPGLVVVRQQTERLGAEPRRAPRTVLERDRRRLALGIVLELPDLAPRIAHALVALEPEDVWRGRLADPETDFEGPPSVTRGVFASLELEGADEACCAAELIEGQEPQRVAHDHAHASAGDALVAGMAEAAEHHREGREAEIRL